MFVTIVINNDNVVNQKKYYEVLVNEKYFIFGTRFNFNLMNIVENSLYHNINDCLKL